MKIKWTNEALEQLIEIEEFISKDSPERTAVFVDQLIEHAEDSLPDNPRMGRTVLEIANPDIRELIFRKYRIVYRLTALSGLVCASRLLSPIRGVRM
ncbi:type II toxin-antitoxin system RelE/ParE family toxin [Geotalea uraniireducens]|uniref:Plasmid stabilization system n=1 Tax=Geotalea uraniireducens (strain Rf4) TaxID=351605 RepID=A5GA72_GEOUR|nr:type II toxin-antitoxin system RelE/ParE family toxin [Geotalea uraniireducens]ABQ25519.1 plasmid stabilization system [Geotalea uraniireducens Rf4]